ncbi:unnamed protein product [Lymnaea stagnalis]|uniref:Amine oxidase domain-containing protein n=1 Tax=Lymnaea stagnalis TaxID=6523 RepID=A0AAV2IBS9_LYMST
MAQVLLFACLIVVAVAQSELRRDPTEKCEREVDVVIVGAGVTGAYSAYRLRNTSQSIEIVERSDRIGGRHYTAVFPEAPNIPVELGVMMYSAEVHDRMAKLVEELDLTQEEYPEAFGVPNEKMYLMRGQHLKEEDIKSGAQIPYNLTPEEKQNQGRFVKYILEKLTGHKEDTLPREDRMKLKVKVTGAEEKELYKYTLEEALDKVTSPDGKAFFYALAKFDSPHYKDASAILAFGNEFDYFSGNISLHKIKEGMDALPKEMISKFLEASEKHNITMNRDVDSIQRVNNTRYLLRLKKTKSEDGLVSETGLDEFICARKVILAIPKDALLKVQWPELKAKPIVDALNALRSVPMSKVVMTFAKRHWQENEATKATVKFTDSLVGKVYELGKSNTSDSYVLLASYAEGEKVRVFEECNQKGLPIAGSEPGELRVTEDMKADVLAELKNVFWGEWKAPMKSAAKFWTQHPFRGGSTVWRAGFHFSEIIERIQHPSQDDDVYIVTRDIADGNKQLWTEGGLESVERIMKRHFF